MKNYENLIKTADIDTAIAMLEAEIKSCGELFDACDEFNALRNKHFG